MYLAIAMDLYSRRIVRWHIDKRMTTDLVNKAMINAYNLRQPKQGLVFHSDRGSQYTSKRFRKLLTSYPSGPAWVVFVGACWDNAVVERFCGSLKHDWILKVLKRESIWNKMWQIICAITTQIGRIQKMVIAHQ